ncbi:DUF433 domain-containing protein [Thiobacillus sedimenti]|uniref:DUF433 domain-containing protein n=1 Tax=Thiobacillus sedimenti TaxID=3110231 RepID=A0ABZ1CMN1_9PROT|nr:DUF433 domain-containing protein [Thiobacillus sp. SCUT-2]WRS39582.1 DUF433 domain-containing protein [Thiobacillus sp. SCUT-2]
MTQRIEKAAIFDQPAYPASEAAYILNLPPATVKAWSFGQTRRDDGSVRFKAVIRAADPRNRLLSFANLCELHVLAAIRRVHRVSLPKVRDSVEFLRSQLGADRPLIDRQFKTNGIDLFVEHASKLLNVSRQGQEALRGEFELALARIERDNQGNPIKLFPFSRTSEHTAQQPKSVVIDPRLSFGRPVLTRSAVPTEVIFDRFQAGDSLEDMSLDYNVDEKEIEEALRFEQRRAA